MYGLLPSTTNNASSWPAVQTCWRSRDRSGERQRPHSLCRAARQPRQPKMRQGWPRHSKDPSRGRGLPGLPRPAPSEIRAKILPATLCLLSGELILFSPVCDGSGLEADSPTCKCERGPCFNRPPEHPQHPQHRRPVSCRADYARCRSAIESPQ